MFYATLAPPAAHEVHVWQWNLDVDDAKRDLYWETLSREEQERAGHFCFERHRRRFIAGRGQLRRLLGDYLDLAPQALTLAYGPEGKPFCASQPDNWTLHFNLSHSENTAALAIANGLEIGIDIECIRPFDESMPVEVFAKRERAHFDALFDPQRQAIFFETWARKEACLKALGTGFVLPPDHFEFDLSLRGDTTPRYVAGDANEATHWRVRALTTIANCAGAVAARDATWSLVFKN
ncbi:MULTISPECIES: 4'-phosphopantetheinyl transferase family protein [unclassified Paraburkholderia]|uniref:4'-phosphopantetheinyl transferase family protein n=1 Tax=unclassified Paraburkholderia TaxID=2615204 RepID=UPI002AB1E0AD|nr:MULTISPECIES: 4'-phosphopantetheinyl transferase superfamily protein [unclassified Paraburkholderia]